MNLYHCMIELKQDAQALAFAAAAEKWLNTLKSRDLIGAWRLYRRKLGLGSAQHSDILLEIEVTDFAQLDAAFSSLAAEQGEDHQRLYEQMHHMIAGAQVALYRPYPDPEQRETVSLV